MAYRPGVSVIIPCYESWPLLHRTLTCVVADCHRLGGQWEVIVVDNDSGTPTLDALLAFASRTQGVNVIQRTGLEGRHFQPGAARNLGIESARFESLVFLDADCIPARQTVSSYRALTARDYHTVYLGHRVFIDASSCHTASVAVDRTVLARAPRVASASNYGHPIDRRMDELRSLETHPRPYDCLFGCNFALHRSCLAEHRFNLAFDGRWGYEDIELGYRLHRAGRRFRYVPTAYVFHQEAEAVPCDRGAERRRNFAVAATLIPGFEEYRRTSARVCAVPEQPLSTVGPDPRRAGI